MEDCLEEVLDRLLEVVVVDMLEILISRRNTIMWRGAIGLMMRFPAKVGVMLRAHFFVKNPYDKYV